MSSVGAAPPHMWRGTHHANEGSLLVVHAQQKVTKLPGVVHLEIRELLARLGLLDPAGHGLTSTRV